MFFAILLQWQFFLSHKISIRNSVLKNLQFSWSVGIQIFTRKHSSRCVPPAFVVPGKGGRVSQGVRYPRGGGYPRGSVYPPRRDMESYIPYPRRNMGPEIPYPPWQGKWPVTRNGPGTRDTLPPCGHIHTCENITFPELRWRAVIIQLLFLGFAAIKCVKKDDDCRWDRQFDECGCSESPRYSLWDPRNLGLSSDGGQYLLMNIITS